MRRIVGLSAALSVMIGASISTADANGTVKVSKIPKKPIEKVTAPAPMPTPAPAPECPSPVPPCPDVFYRSGIYAGAQGGYNYMRGKISNKFTPLNGQLDQDRGTKTDNGIIGELFIGARYFFHTGVSMGFDLAINWDTNHLKKNITHPTNNFKIKFSRDYCVVPAITVGRIFQERWHFFGKLGLGISRFKTRIDNAFAGLSFNRHKVKAGVVPSLGLEYGFNEYLSALGTVTYEYYDSVNTNISNADGKAGFMTNSVRRLYYLAPKIGFVAKF